MGGCFPCFGSSNKEGGGNGVKEVAKKESFKDGSAAQSHHVNRVSSGTMSSSFLSFFGLLFFIFIFVKICVCGPWEGGFR